MIKIAFDIGGTEIKSAVVSHGELEMYDKVPTPKNENQAIVKTVIQRLEVLSEAYQTTDIHVGISTAGAVNQAQKKIAYANPNILNYTGTNFETYLKNKVQQLHVYNDVDAALLGELTQYENFPDSIFCLTLGTGIGGSFYHKDFGLLSGARHRPNQIGYLLYDPETGTDFEHRASTRALKHYLETQSYSHKDIPLLFEEAETGNEKAQRLLINWGDEVARGIAQVQLMYDPSEIIIGGGISAQQERLLQYIVPNLGNYLPSGYGHATVRCARLNNDAALIGAVSRL
ncbi:ROK family protein [Staphylococcus canis]|uniref:ROK family protein n=1 Tax=Staphylococcus canis TaxID=2724942 RepID=A0ABS0T7R8_9STAP|nr:ROK family protein [Staphylococcus canis]MBI5974615.1 ROK family protein [Staphylococcus canis]